MQKNREELFLTYEGLSGSVNFTLGIRIDLNMVVMSFQVWSRNKIRNKGTLEV